MRRPDPLLKPPRWEAQEFPSVYFASGLCILGVGRRMANQEKARGLWREFKPEETILSGVGADQLCTRDLDNAKG